MTLREAVHLCLNYPEARMAFTVKHPTLGHNYGIGTARIASVATDGTVSVEDQVTADPGSERTYNFNMRDVQSWSLRLEASGQAWGE